MKASSFLSCRIDRDTRYIRTYVRTCIPQIWPTLFISTETYLLLEQIPWKDGNTNTPGHLACLPHVDEMTWPDFSFPLSWQSSFISFSSSSNVRSGTHLWYLSLISWSQFLLLLSFFMNRFHRGVCMAGWLVNILSSFFQAIRMDIHPSADGWMNFVRYKFVTPSFKIFQRRTHSTIIWHDALSAAKFISI